MTITYGPAEEKYSIGNKTRTSYGIVAYADADNNDTVTIIASIHDITSDKSKLIKLIELCNSENLSLIHLEDIIEDCMFN